MLQAFNLDGMTADMLSVFVGDENCTDVRLTETAVICKPPKEKPENTVVMVRILIPFHVGRLHNAAIQPY